MNKTLTLSVIALVAVVMVTSTLGDYAFATHDQGNGKSKDDLHRKNCDVEGGNDTAQNARQKHCSEPPGP